jgi:hypothetical protein
MTSAAEGIEVHTQDTAGNVESLRLLLLVE